MANNSLSHRKKSASRFPRTDQPKLFEVQKRGPKVFRFVSVSPDLVIADALQKCRPSKYAPRRECIDIREQKFGLLTAKEYIGIQGDKRPLRLWLCKCDCGNYIAVKQRELKSGQTRSCGCFRKSTMLKRAGANKLPAGESAFRQLFYNYEKSARERGYVWSLDRDYFREITQQPCAYCGAPPVIKYRAARGTNGSYIGNGIDRIENTIGYLPDNVRPCCSTCNCAKASMSEREFAEWVTAVFEKFARPFGESGAKLDA